MELWFDSNYKSRKLKKIKREKKIKRVLFLFILSYLKMLPQRLGNLLKTVAPITEKKDIKPWKAISPEQRLVITLRFLASEESQPSLS